jgi:hypothetical protein
MITTNFSRLAWLLGSVSAVGLGAVVAACGGSSNVAEADAGSEASKAADSGSHAGSGTGSLSGSGGGSSTGSGSGSRSGTGGEVGGGDSGVPGNGSGTGGSDAGTCRKPPGKLRPSDGGLTCLTSGDAATKTDMCGSGEHCCESVAGGSCLPVGTACGTGEINIQCVGAGDCAAEPGKMCCGTGNVTTVPACGSYPPFSALSGGTKCKASCSGSFIVCTKDDDCPGGTVGACVPAVSADGKTRQFGYCAESLGDGGS